MFDSVNVSELPAGDYAYAGYVNGRWPTYQGVVSTFPGHSVLSIAVTASADAECLDIENGDATASQAPSWVQRQLARGVTRPVLYTSASNVDTVVAMCAVAGIGRSSVRIWSAHYGAGEHICGPNTCRACKTQADGTQWNDKALGRNLDQSVLADDFFSAVAPTPAPSVPTPDPFSVEAEVAALPTIAQNANGQFVRILQGLLVANGRQVAVDGAFGPATSAAVRNFQQATGLSVDGVAGPATWRRLLCV